MDFNLPEELQLLKDTVRKFVDREMIRVTKDPEAQVSAAPPDRSPVDDM